MKTKLIRDNEIVPAGYEQKSLDDSEFIEKCLVQIADNTKTISELDESESIISKLADILELMNAYLIKANIKPEDLMRYAESKRNVEGAFSKKLEITTSE